MTMTVEEARFASDLRRRILENINAGQLPHTGISAEDLEKAIAYCRKDYTANQTKSKASGVSSPAAVAAVDLNSLFTNKASK